MLDFTVYRDEYSMLFSFKFVVCCVVTIEIHVNISS